MVVSGRLLSFIIFKIAQSGISGLDSLIGKREDKRFLDFIKELHQDVIKPTANSLAQGTYINYACCFQKAVFKPEYLFIFSNSRFGYAFFRRSG